MASREITRRRWLAAAAPALALPWLPGLARAAFEPDGPARARPLADRSLLLDVVRAGSRLVACGERGHVLVSDDDGATWRQAKTVPTRTTLTAMHAADARTVWAVGHGGVVLKSADAGDTWNVAAGKADGREVLLAVRVDADGRGLAVGGYGYALATADGGANWKPFGVADGEAGEKHLNRIVVSSKGTWLIAAEGGTVLRSTDRGATFVPVKTPYAGSLWAGAALGDGTLLMAGMRGNLVRSTDDGRSWAHQQVAGAGSFTGVAEIGGRAVLVGVDGTLVVGAAGGEKFQFHPQEDRVTLTALVPKAAGGALVASTAAGMREIRLPA